MIYWGGGNFMFIRIWRHPPGSASMGGATLSCVLLCDHAWFSSPDLHQLACLLRRMIVGAGVDFSGSISLLSPLSHMRFHTQTLLHLLFAFLFQYPAKNL